MFTQLVNCKTFARDAMSLRSCLTWGHKSKRQQQVFMVSSPDGAILLDLEAVTKGGGAGVLIKLDSVGADMWKLIAKGKTDAEVVDTLLKEYRADKITLERGLATVLQNASALGLRRDAIIITVDECAELAQTLPSFPWYGLDGSTPLNDDRHRATKWMTLCAWMLMFLLDGILARISVPLMLRSVKSCPVRRRKDGGDIGTLLGKLCCAVQSACVWYGWSRKTCLPRSAATAVMLRLWGVPGTMVIATRVMPVFPHSYVRVGDSIINDYPTVTRFYQQLVTF
jgi:hypothetical protein